jgi:hypothetical protein
MEEVAVAGVQQPFVLGPHRDATMARRVAGQRASKGVSLRSRLGRSFVSAWSNQPLLSR